MKVVLAGAYGKLGSEILRSLLKAGHEVVAADLIDRPVDGIDPSTYVFKKLDVTQPAALKGLCDGAEAVITTVGLTGVSATVTAYDIDYQGNLNLLAEAKAAGVKHFVYISVIRADEAPDIPMLDAKNKFEQELKKSGLSYVIHRPTGYFYDIVKVFRPMIEKGAVTLLGKKPVHANVVDTPDFADFIVAHMTDTDACYNVGGKETWSYEEIATMCFEAAGKPVVIKRAPAFLFDILGAIPANRKAGKQPVMKFGKWTMTHEMVADTKVGEASFKAYIAEQFKGGR